MSKPKILEMEEIIKNKREIIWENENPANQFASQTIKPENFSKYDEIKISLYRNYGNNKNTSMVSIFIAKGDTSEVVYTDYFSNDSRVWSRTITFSDNGIYFGGAVINGELNNSALVPYKIEGVL